MAVIVLIFIFTIELTVVTNFWVEDYWLFHPNWRRPNKNWNRSSEWHDVNTIDKKNFSGWVSFFTLAPLFLLENSHETQERWCTTSVGVCLCKRGVREKEREREIERLGKPLKVEKARPASSSVLHSQKEGQRLERLPIKKEEKAEARLAVVKK